MKCRFETSLSERMMLGMLDFLDDKYPDHAQHTLNGWAQLRGEGFTEHYGFMCSCGDSLILTYAEAVAFDKRPLHG